MSDLGGLIFQFGVTQAQQHLMLTSSQVCPGECVHFRELLTDSWVCMVPWFHSLCSHFRDCCLLFQGV